jgi:inner membrane transporter RhtA
MSMTAARRSLTSPAALTAMPYLALLLGMISLAIGTSYAKQLFPIVGAEGASTLRVGLSALVLVALWRPWRFRLSRADLGRVLLYGLVLGLMNLSFYMSLRTIPLGLAIAIEFSGPLVLALIHARRLIHFVWIACAVVGLGMLLPIWSGAHSLDPVGVAFAAAAGVFWALYIVFGKRLSHMHAGQSVALGMSTAALVILPFGIATAGTSLLVPSVLIVGLCVAVASSALPYSLEMIALRHIPKRTFGVLLSGEPAIGALAGLVLLHEQLSSLQWLAIGCIIIASIGAILTTGRETPADAPVPTAN